MNWQAVNFDWNQARAFLATVEEGSLSAAARALGQTQPTLGRQVSALEAQLGVTLFERAGRSFVLTQAGLGLLEHFRAMGDAATRASLAASGQAQAIAGKVSITATSVMATYHLPPVLKHIREAAPEIEIEIVVSNDLQNLTEREADIAIRHARPTQPELIARLLSESPAHFYASPLYLDRVGRPSSPAEMSKLDFIGLDNPERMLPTLNGLGLNLTRNNFKLISASGTVLYELVRQGLGVSIFVKETADLFPDLEIVLPTLDPIMVPTWLATHRELHTSRRIRLVFDLLAQALAEPSSRPFTTAA